MFVVPVLQKPSLYGTLKGTQLINFERIRRYDIIRFGIKRMNKVVKKTQRRELPGYKSPNTNA